MAKLVFDIETSALPLDHFDEAQKEYLFRECEKIAEETARTTRRSEIYQQCSLWPFTAQVVCIAMLNADTTRGQVLYTVAQHEPAAASPGPVEFKSCLDEAELLTAFWDVARHYDTIVTFNGRLYATRVGLSKRMYILDVTPYETSLNVSPELITGGSTATGTISEVS